jgi:hypothetical protein
MPQICSLNGFVMVRKFLMIVMFFGLAASSAGAQIREVPPAVKEVFEKQYPDAQNVVYKDLLASVQVYFTEGDEKYIAKYNNKGMWRETEKEWNFGHLSPEVKDGFSKSKYADWEVEETKIIYRHTNKEFYRVKVKKNKIQVKYLLFNGNGRLVEEDFTL